jgi:hypothetical protein
MKYFVRMALPGRADKTFIHYLPLVRVRILMTGRGRVKRQSCRARSHHAARLGGFLFPAAAFLPDTRTSDSR